MCRRRPWAGAPDRVPAAVPDLLSHGTFPARHVDARCHGRGVADAAPSHHRSRQPGLPRRRARGPQLAARGGHGPVRARPDWDLAEPGLRHGPVHGRAKIHPARPLPRGRDRWRGLGARPIANRDASLAWARHDVRAGDDAGTSVPAFRTRPRATKGGPNKASEVLLHLIYVESFEFLRTGRGAALTVIYLAIVVGITMLQTKLVERRVHYA